MALTIDLLYTEDCTTWQIADQLLRQALTDLGLDAQINYWLVKSDRQAIEWRFAGSPTIFVNGQDLFPIEHKAVYGLTLRSYVTPEGLLGYPTYAMLYEALQAYAGY